MHLHDVETRDNRGEAQRAEARRSPLRKGRAWVPLAVVALIAGGSIAAGSAVAASEGLSQSIERVAPAGTTQAWIDIEASGLTADAVEVLLDGKEPSSRLLLSTTAFGVAAIAPVTPGPLQVDVVVEGEVTADIAVTFADPEDRVLESSRERVVFTRMTPSPSPSGSASPSPSPSASQTPASPSPSPSTPSPTEGSGDGDEGSGPPSAVEKDSERSGLPASGGEIAWLLIALASVLAVGGGVLFWSARAGKEAAR